MILGTGNRRHGYVGVKKEGTGSSTEQIAALSELGVPTLELDCANCIVSQGRGMCGDVRNAGSVVLRELQIEKGFDARRDEEILEDYRQKRPVVDIALKAACRTALAPYLPMHEEANNGAPEVY